MNQCKYLFRVEEYKAHTRPLQNALLIIKERISANMGTKHLPLYVLDIIALLVVIQKINTLLHHVLRVNLLNAALSSGNVKGEVNGNSTELGGEELKKPNELQRKVLELADRMGRIDYYDAATVGGRGPTLNKLTKDGLLSKGYTNGGHSWMLTTKGKAAIG